MAKQPAYKIRGVNIPWTPPEPVRLDLSPNEEVLLIEPRGEWLFVYIGRRG